MLISSLPFHFVASFLIFILILSSSVSIKTIEKKCTTDDDCGLELMCNTKSKICTCPEPYFWDDDIHACVGCATGWLELQTNKCFLLAISHSPGVTWYEAQTICRALIAQPLLISSTDEFIALQHKIEYILNGNDALTATLYFHQGAWIQIDNKWIESYIWCNNDEKRDSSNCVQIRQNSITNTICLQYVSCIEQSQYICEASPRIQSELEINIADVEHHDIKESNQKRMVRAPPKITTKTTAKPQKQTTKPQKQTTKPQKQTTKKKPGVNINNVANSLTDGVNAAGQVWNAVGNIHGGNANQNLNPQNNLVDNFNNQEIPLALASDDEKNTNPKNTFFYGGLIIGGVVLLIIIIIIIIFFLKKKKTTGNSKTSIESATSVVSYE